MRLVSGIPLPVSHRYPYDNIWVVPSSNTHILLTVTGDFLVASSGAVRRSASSLSLPSRLLTNPFWAGPCPDHHCSVDKPLSNHWWCLLTIWRVLECFYWWNSKTSFSHTGSLTLGYTRVSGGCAYKVHMVSAPSQEACVCVWDADPVWLACEGCESSWDQRGQQTIEATPQGLSFRWLSLRCAFFSFLLCQGEVFSRLAWMKTHVITLRREVATGHSMLPSPKTLLKGSIFPRENIWPLWVVWNRCHGEQMPPRSWDEMAI